MKVVKDGDLDESSEFSMADCWRSYFDCCRSSADSAVSVVRFIIDLLTYFINGPLVQWFKIPRPRLTPFPQFRNPH